MTAADPPPPPWAVLREGYEELPHDPGGPPPGRPSSLWRAHGGGGVVERRFEGAALADPTLRPVVQLLFGPLTEDGSLGGGAPMEEPGEIPLLEIVWEEDGAPVARTLLLADGRLVLDAAGELRLQRRLGAAGMSLVRAEMRSAGWIPEDVP
jgi:hypothetical protein